MLNLESVVTPITLTFLIIAIGFCLGRIRVRCISLDLAGVLITAVAGGYLMVICGSDSDLIAEMQSSMKLLSSLGTALFVSVIGISTGYSFDSKCKNAGFAAFTGALMVVCAFVVARIILMLDSQANYSQLLGVLCGALTTTPGLSSVCELDSVLPEQAVLGYGSAYLFGVVFTVLFVQIIPRGTDKQSVVPMSFDDNRGKGVGAEWLLQICVAVIAGYLLGNFRVPILNVSLGSTGGILCAGMIVGLLVQTSFPDRCMPKHGVEMIRSLGLVLFFVGAGVPAGIRLNEGIELRMILYGIVLTIVPILVGWLVCKIVPMKNSPISIIAGGMTSTPAIGVLIQKNKEVSLEQYSFAYTGALLTIVVLL